MSELAVMYCNCMEEVKTRIALALSVVEGTLSVGREDFAAELVCVQLRKVLELIAFASLTANKSRYSETYRDFSQHWNAKRLLMNLERIHPNFYPCPIESDCEDEPGVKHFRDLADGFLTRDEFVNLYRKCSEVLHVRNPFQTGEKVINFGLSIKEWIARIQKLLAVHYMRLVDSQELWLVYMQSPKDGKVHALIVSPRQAAI